MKNFQAEKRAEQKKFATTAFMFNTDNTAEKISRGLQIAKLLAVILLVPAFAGAQEKMSAGAGQPAAQAEPGNIADGYRTVAGELLKNCEGADKKIAVAGFSYPDGRDSGDGGIVAERITAELVKAGKIKVIGRKEIEKVSDDLKLQRSAAIYPDSAKAIGKLLGADWVVVGTLAELPDKQLELNARLVGARSGEILSAASGRLKKDWLERYRVLLYEKSRASSGNPNDAQTLYEWGALYADFEKYDNAKAYFNVALSVNPAHFKAYVNRGTLYYRSGEYDKAIEDYSRATAIAPKSAVAYINRGNAYFSKRDYDKAIEDYSKGIELDPKEAAAYVVRGNAYAAKGEFDKAIEDYSRATAVDPKAAAVYTVRGNLYADKGEYGKAVKDYSKAIAIDGGSARVYVSRGLAYGMRGEHEKAIEDYSKAIELEPGDAAVYYIRRNAYLVMGESGKAAADEEKYRSLAQK